MFSVRFGEILQGRNISGYRIAKETGISQGLMAEYIRGKKLPTIHNLVKIADYLDCSIDYLLSHTDKKEKSTPGDRGGPVDPLCSTLLHNFDQLNQEGRERLVETSDDMVSSGKYKKGRAAELGKEA